MEKTPNRSVGRSPVEVAVSVGGNQKNHPVGDGLISGTSNHTRDNSAGTRDREFQIAPRICRSDESTAEYLPASEPGGREVDLRRQPGKIHAESPFGHARDHERTVVGHLG